MLRVVFMSVLVLVMSLVVVISLFVGMSEMVRCASVGVSMVSVLLVCASATRCLEIVLVVLMFYWSSVVWQMIHIYSMLVGFYVCLVWVCLRVFVSSGALVVKLFV